MSAIFSICRDILDIQDFVFDHLSYKMVLHVNVLCMCMEFVVIR